MVPTFQHWRRKLYYCVLEDLNYGILRIYSEFCKKNRKNTRRPSEEHGASKDTMHRRLRRLDNHTEAIDLYS